MRSVSGCNTKCDALRACGTLNPHPERIKDSMFCGSEHAPCGFFDVHDMAQVKYEMLRRVRVEHASVNSAAAAFGFSRMTWYHLQNQYTTAGMAGLLPQTRGPKQGYKLSATLSAAMRQQRAEDPNIQITHLQDRLSKRFGVWVHLPSLDRALHAPIHPKKR